MNNKQMIVSLFIVFIMFFSIFVITAPAFAEADDIHVRAGIIVEINEEEDYCVVEDACGLIWKFYEVEDFTVGDVVIMTMWDANTPETILDDEIVDVVYSGYIAAELK